LVDIDSGHWPMLTRPERLARLLHEIAAGCSAAGGEHADPAPDQRPARSQFRY
jgi:hypothetical protein